MAESGQRRRSARILALEDIMKTQQANCEEYEAFINREIEEPIVDALTQREPGSAKRGRKRKVRQVDQVIENNSKGVLVEEVQAEQGQQNLDHENQSNNNIQPAEKSSATQLPEKRVLKLVYDELKRKDTRDIFAEPVDPIEVEGYYEIVQDPMDFFTVREKLEQGAYKTLEEFERDIFLIFDNAILFNDENTVFHKQARSMHGLATKIFHALRSNPKNFESAHMPKKRGRKPKLEAKMKSNPTTSYALNGKPQSSPKVEKVGTKEVRQSNIAGVGSSRCNMRPWTSYLNEPEALVSEMSSRSRAFVPQGSLPYRESITRFAEGLGPTAQMVVNRKLQQGENGESSKFFATTGIRDLNLPPETKNGGLFAMVADACKPENTNETRVLGVDLSSSSAKTNNFGSSSMPFQARGRGLMSSTRFPSSIPSSFQLQRFLQGETQVSGPSYASVISPQTGRPVSVVQPTARMSGLVPNRPGGFNFLPQGRVSYYPTQGNRTMAAPSQIHGDPNIVHRYPIFRDPGMQLYGDNRQANNTPVFPPTQSYGVTNSSSQSHKLWGSPQYVDTRQVATPSYGIVNSDQPKSQPTLWGAQAVNKDGIYMQPRVNAMMNSWNFNNGFMQPQVVRQVPAGSDAAALQESGGPNQESGGPKALLDNEEPNVSLQL